MRWDYYRRAALHMGVQRMWADDAAQDIALRLWRQNRDDPTALRRAAIDAARRYGMVSRYGYSRRMASLASVDVEPEWDEGVPAGEVPHEALWAPDMIEPRAQLRAVTQAVGLLTARQRRALRRAVMGDRDLDRDAALRYQARRRLRQLCA